jgi:hypothetical protein
MSGPYQVSGADTVTEVHTSNQVAFAAQSAAHYAACPCLRMRMYETTSLWAAEYLGSGGSTQASSEQLMLTGSLAPRCCVLTTP